jgi:hypothetical protein
MRAFPGRANHRTVRRGQILCAELLLILPFVFLLLFGMIQFSLQLTARQQTTAASREAARVAATGGSQEEIEATARFLLGVAPDAELSVQTIWIRDGEDEAAPVKAVAVRVSRPAGQVIPDLLRVIGISMQGQEIVGQTIMRTEF